MKDQPLNRRSFVKKSAILTAAAPLIWSCSSDKKPDAGNALAEKVKTQLGLQMYTLRNQLNSDLKGTLSMVAETGYNYVELFSYRDRMYFDMAAADFYQLVKGYGLDIVSSHHLTGRAASPAQGTLLNGWEQAVEDAALAGQEYMVCAYLMPEERETLDDYKEVAELLNKAGEVSRAAGIQLCYHNHAFEFEKIEGETPMYLLLDQTDPELVQVELDLYWVAKAGLDSVDFFNKYEGRIPLWHVKDMADTMDGEFTEVGNGIIDFKRIFNSADKAGMKRFFVEQDQSEDPISSIKSSYNYLNNIL